MITLKQWMEVVGYRITEGSDYTWNCYGHNAYSLDSWNGDQEGHSLSIVFDTQTQVVYEVTAYDYARERAYILVNPDYRDLWLKEGQAHGVDPREAWEGVNYVELEVEEDFLEKAQGIVNDQEYDTRVQIPVNFDRDDLMLLMTLAHEADMSLNAYVEMTLTEYLTKLAKN